MPVSDWLPDWHTLTCTHSFTGSTIVLFRLSKVMCTTTIQPENKRETMGRQDRAWEEVRGDVTHSRSVLRGIFLGMVLRPSPWQSTVTPLQVHKAGQALALPMIRAESISSHIHCPAGHPMPASKQLPVMDMFPWTLSVHLFLCSCPSGVLLHLTKLEWFNICNLKKGEKEKWQWFPLS